MSFEVVSLKKKGNIALNSGNYPEAWKHYTDALNLLLQNFNINDEDGVRVKSFSSNSHQESCLYSKRSVALLKVNQYYYAYEDAKQVTNVSPEWFKGYLRKANIELQCGLLESALKNYQMALRYLNRETKQDSKNRYDKFINQSVKHVLFMMQRERCFSYQIPWIGAAFGLVVGMAIVTWDYVSHRPFPYLNHPILKIFIIGFSSFIFFYLANLQRYFNRKSKENLLMPPHRS